MAKATERPTGESPPEEETVADPKGALDRLADLTRRIVAVPKEEVPAIFAKPKKKRAKRRG